MPSIQPHAHPTITLQEQAPRSPSLHGGQIGVRLPVPQLSSWLPSAGVLISPLCHKGLSNLLMTPDYCWERTEKHHCIFGKAIFLGPATPKQHFYYCSGPRRNGWYPVSPTHAFMGRDLAWPCMSLRRLKMFTKGNKGRKGA